MERKVSVPFRQRNVLVLHSPNHLLVGDISPIGIKDDQGHQQHVDLQVLPQFPIECRDEPIRIFLS